MRTDHRSIVLAAVAVIILMSSVSAQPVASSRQSIGGLELFSDLKKKGLFYFAPGKLSLAAEADGRPRFQLLEMRYTGTGVYGDRGEKRFLNILQFSVTMAPVEADAIPLAKAQLGGRHIELRPLPVKGIEAIITAPIKSADQNNMQRIGKNGSFQKEENNNVSDKYSFWTERTFTLKLENHEAQLLWDQVSNGQLALSVTYSFFSDMVGGPDADVMAVANGKDVSKKLGLSEEDKTTEPDRATHLVFADAFPVRVDVTRYPDLIRKIDVGEEVPPAYAALEVTCYDFTHDFRPDLALKAVEIEATGVGGFPVLLPPKKFLSSDPDLHTVQINFPYAVKLTTPYRYRVIEYTREGARNISAWKSAESWVSSLDITTPESNRQFQRQSFEVEVPPLSENGLDSVDVFCYYKFRNKINVMPIRFNAVSGNTLQPVTFTSDKGSALVYKVAWHYADKEKFLETNLQDLVLLDDYVFLQAPGDLIAEDK